MICTGTYALVQGPDCHCQCNERSSSRSRGSLLARLTSSSCCFLRLSLSLVPDGCRTCSVSIGYVAPCISRVTSMKERGVAARSAASTTTACRMTAAGLPAPSTNALRCLFQQPLHRHHLQDKRAIRWSLCNTLPEKCAVISTCIPRRQAS